VLQIKPSAPLSVDETLPNFIERKHQKGRDKEIRGKDRSPGNQTAQQRWATRRKGSHQEPNPPPVS
jgi:hypothetical protein